MKDLESTTDYDEDDIIPCHKIILRSCAQCIMNNADIPLFFVSLLVLFLSVNRCCYCVVVVAIISALTCMRFRVMNATLWSALIVLYWHKDWNINFGNVQIVWNRS
jgi:hypothetical protein